MRDKRTAPFGSWKSPISSDFISAGVTGLGEIVLDGSDVYWIESRSIEGGRNRIVRKPSDGPVQDVTGPEFDARTRVHEYGGGAYLAGNGSVVFSNFNDNGVYIQRSGKPPEPLTSSENMRYADFVIDHLRNRIICVREDHTGRTRETTNTLSAIALDGGGESVLVSGNDFYSSPRVSPDGKRLAWLTWHHPNMPWDGAELWVAEIDNDGLPAAARLIAGSAAESICQPEWSPGGVLYFVSDRSGWWNLYRAAGDAVEPVVQMEAEFGAPHWTFGMSAYAFESNDRIVCAYNQNGAWLVATLDPGTSKLTPIDTQYTDISSVRAGSGNVTFRGGSPIDPFSIVQLDLSTGNSTVLRRSISLVVDPEYLSAPQAIEFPTSEGKTAHGLYYQPKNPDYAGEAGELPPVLVISHGGPTGGTSTALSLPIQYWTSRGIGVLDVNYGGSTGYGRAYRERLNGQWGVVDVDDCINGARYLVERGEADPNRLIIRGASAGGYTTLAALTFRNVFKAGASYFGVSDLEALERDCHKFESRYNHSLVGPYPEKADLYRERSPIHFTDRLACPIILFQGLDDKVVPANQAELMFEAVRKKGLPVAYVPFEGEGHGFRRAENIKRAMDAELYFYSRIFGFDLADEIEPVKIENL